ncbi:MAG TPA: tryptophan 2,3-dioxygenase family protein [Micromonosporaceae bacterium]|nr:tryptophan 2,3-dioxygenase family protein [Micromonosporaceae bacterium]
MPAIVDTERGVGSRTYGEVLRLDELLTMQEDIAEIPDTRFFITVHQITELWFMVILHELEHSRAAIAADDIPQACYRLRRVARIEDVLVTQVSAIESLSPGGFAVIRERLAASSGFQSAQFREVEFLSGLKDPRYLELVDVTAVERRRLERRLAEPSLVDEFEALFARRGRPDLVAVTRGETDPELFALVEGLLDHDAGFARWRAVHALMVERLIGYKPGTGGSAGVAYLKSTTDKRFFPKLWQIRSSL